MTKDQLQVKPGIKPSQLKKLKRSKSEGDIPKAPPLPTAVPLSKSQSQLEIPLTQSNSKSPITQLQTQIQFHSQTAQNYLKSLQISQAKVSELEEKLKSKPLNQLAELDNSLIARHKNLKDWFTQYSKNKDLDSELKENIDEASTELISQDQTISQLRGENNQLKKTNQSLQKDLQLSQRLAELRKSPLPNSATGKNLPQNLFYCLFIALLIYSLIGSNPKPNEN